MNRKRGLSRLWLCAIATLATALTAACGAGSGPSSSQQQSGTADAGSPRSGGDLVFDRSEDAKTLDPAVATDNNSIWALEQIYQTLYAAKPDGSGVEPQLATGYKVSADKLTWTFTLRSGVKFSDGTPLTAKDVAFSLNRARTNDQGFGYIDAAIKSVDAPDDSTVVIKTKYAWAPLLADLSLFTNGIVPNNLDGKSASEFFEHPIGTGPFEFASWQHGESLKLTRNPHYWENGKPYLDSVTFKNVPDDNTRAVQLKSGQADVMMFPPLSTVASLSKQPGVVVKTYPSTDTFYLLMNEKVQPFQDVKVRQAICYALNRKAMVGALLSGYGTVATSYMPEGEYHSDVSPGCSYDLDKAKQLMSQSSAPNGFSVKFLTDNSTQNSQLAQIVQKELEPLGIKVTIETVDVNQLFTTQGKGKYQMSVNDFTYDIPDPDELTEFLLSPPGGHAGSYYTNYDNPAMNKLVADAAKELDNDKRAELYKQIQDLQMQDVPQVPLFYSPLAYAFSDSVRGFSVAPLGNYHLEDVWLSK